MFFANILSVLDKSDLNPSSQLIIGGDFNVHLDAEMDNGGGRVEKKDSVKNIFDIKLAYDLVDIWRIRNPDKRQYTWRQKRPVVQRRLDYWLISDCMQDFIENTDIIPSIKSDHSAITLQINSIEDKVRGPSHWMFNSSLLEDNTYIELISSSLEVWLKEFDDIHDKQLLWDLVKYRIRQTTISYSKRKAKVRRNKLVELESKLKESELLCTSHPSEKNLEDLEKYKIEYDSIYDYITQGNIIRSKAAWYEKGEKNNKYFLNLEKSRKAKNCIRKLLNKEGQEIINSKAIMSELKDFYEDLYDNKDPDTDVDELHNFAKNLTIPKLSNYQQLLCEGQLTNTECYNVLDQLKNNKSPGNDGLTAEFYKHFWPVLGNFLVDSLNAAHITGKLSNSQRQAVIRLIEKKDKDKWYIENWRPISLLNVDYKIGSKALATRLEKVLPDIINQNQCAYVKGRTIFDAIRSINDVMEYTKLNNIPGLMTSFDFKKAFDSLNWQYLVNTLEAFNFGESFIRWVKVFYSDISSCVMNNGFASQLFEIKRGVRQGDPLSPYLFIIALEILNISIRENKEIIGIKVGNEEIKLNVFADDLTTFVKNTRSFFSLKQVINNFGYISGLKLNEEKTEVYWLGSLHNSPEDLGIDNVNKPMKILGIFFTYDWQKFQELNFEKIITSIKKSLNVWQWRNLTLLGRIQIIKTFAIPKFMFRASQIPLTKEIIKEINSVLFKFVWKSRKDKIKRKTLISDYKNGGLRMPHLETLIKTQRIMCMKKYFDSYNSTWKVFLENYLSEFGGSFLLKYNYDIKFLPKTLPRFYKECLNEWASYKETHIHTPSNVLNEIIWNNKFICIGAKPLFRNRIAKKGIIKLCDLLDDTGKLKTWDVLQSKNITMAEYFLLMSVFDTIPLEWKNILKQQLQMAQGDGNNSNDIVFPTTSRVLYWDLVKKFETNPTSKYKYEELFPTTDLPWQEIYLIPRNVTVDTKTREFQFKYLHRIVFTNKALFKMGIVSSSLCTFCGKFEESLEHLFIHCEITSSFWLSVTEWLKIYFTNLQNLNACNITFGFFRKDFLLLNHIVILSKQVVFQCRNLNIKPSLSLLKARMKTTYELELSIAKQNQTLEIHNKKWKELLPVVSGLV